MKSPPKEPLLLKRFITSNHVAKGDAYLDEQKVQNGGCFVHRYQRNALPKHKANHSEKDQIRFSPVAKKRVSITYDSPNRLDDPRQCVNASG